MRILCSISTRGRYENYLPMTIASAANQTQPPDHLTIYDDNDNPVDLRSIETYLHLFRMLDSKGIGWGVVYGNKKGQHHNHQIANTSGYDLVWRMDDDCIAEPDVLEKLKVFMIDGVGAVGGSVMVPSMVPAKDRSSLIGDFDTKPNKQWGPIEKTEEVDHLHCSFLYRAGVTDYDLRLSRRAHREETMFTYSLKCKGYRILVTPCVTWHLRAAQGGIRLNDDARDYQHDEQVFRRWLEFQKSGKRLFVMNGGLGDNYMFLQVVRPPQGSVVATCYPHLYEKLGLKVISIAEAHEITDVESHNIYAWCARKNWKGHLMDAFREKYRDVCVS